MADGPVRTDARTVLMNVAAIDLVLLWAVLVAIGLLKTSCPDRRSSSAGE
jgi:hypothetical protein